MVKRVQEGGSVFYECEVCGLMYTEEETARDCQEYCSKHGACSLEIAKKAVKRM